MNEDKRPGAFREFVRTHDAELCALFAGAACVLGSVLCADGDVSMALAALGGFTLLATALLAMVGKWL